MLKLKKRMEYVPSKPKSSLLLDEDMGKRSGEEDTLTPLIIYF